MTARRKALRSRIGAAFLWAAVLYAGAGIFLPALLDLFHSRKMERQEALHRTEAETRLRETDRILNWHLNDPQADEKLFERLFGRPYQGAGIDKTSTFRQ
ncbi:MAG: hypothetical protein ACE5H3_05425 [Planctomycetota bacterium]